MSKRKDKKRLTSARESDRLKISDKEKAVNNLIDALWVEFATKQVEVLHDPKNENLRRELKNLADAIKELAE
jgi:hypothetical protein